MIVNLAASKIVVFRKEGKLAKNEKWWYGSKLVEEVNEYKYLDVVFTSKLSVKPCLQDRILMAKFCVNNI